MQARLSRTQKSNWKNTFPKIMNSYEFELMSKFSLSLASKFPKIICLHPFNGGVAVAFKIGKRIREVSLEVST